MDTWRERLENVERGFGDKMFRVVARATMMIVK
jgi:hypothetical protein